MKLRKNKTKKNQTEFHSEGVALFKTRDMQIRLGVAK